MSKTKFLSLLSLVFIVLFGIYSQPALAYIPEQDMVQAFQISGVDDSLSTEQTADSVFTDKIQLEDSKEKLNDAQKKLSSDLLQIIEEEESAAQSVSQTEDQMATSAIPMSAMDTGLDAAGSELVYVYIYLNPDTPTSVLKSYSNEITDRDEANHLAVARVKISMLDDIASLPGVRTIRKVIPPEINAGSALTEGDGLHRADLLRQRLGFDGSGIKVGIISDGVDHWLDAKDAGDLPVNFCDDNILRNEAGGDEGTAMLEIVHDIAPGAELYFHDCGSNILEFNEAIDELIDAGCNIICDDISWIAEPFFEDGLVAQHVQTVLEENNILYLSAAGNRTNIHYQGMFCNDGNNRHDFSNQGGAVKDLRFDISPGYSVGVVLEWNDKFGESANDYDIYAYNRSTGDILNKSTYSQDGNDDPLEGFEIQNPSASMLPVSLAVEKYTGDDRELEIYIYGNAKFYSYNFTAADSIYGHLAVPGVITVGAMNAVDPTRVAYYSSQGPVKIYYPEPELRNKPDICGIDGVDVTGAGGFSDPFYGTSASAPHVAALAALSWSAAPDLSAAELRENLLASAIDLGAPGFDNVYGYGRADVLNSVMTAVYADHLWVSSSSPLWGEQMAPVDEAITINFSSDIQEGSSFDAISLLNEEGQAIAAEKSINEKTLTLIPENNLAYDTHYTVHILSDAVQDLSGNSMDADSSISFKTISETVDIPDDGLKQAVMDNLHIIDRDIRISDMEALTWLDASQYGIIDLTGLEYAENLKELYLSDNQINDVSPIAGLTDLTDLFIDKNQITDISALAGLGNLQRLYLSNNQILNGLSIFENLTHLKELVFSNTETDDLSFLQDLSNLELLVLNGNNIDDISSLTGLINLKTLYLGNNDLNSDDLVVLQALSKLEMLDLSGNNITDINALAAISTLKGLNLNKNQIQSMPDLSNLINLEYLNLNENTVTDISALQGLTQLEVLYLNTNQLQNLPDLSSLSGLYKIDLSNNQLSDITGLAGITGLEIIDLSNNLIADISVLANFHKIWFLNLAENQLTDISALVYNSQGSSLDGFIADLSQNYLDLSEDSPVRQDLEYLLALGASINYEPQQELLPLQLNTESLPEAFTDYPYNIKLQAIGGISPYHWMISDGQLPAGLSMTEDGVISGQPGADSAASTSFTIDLVDNSEAASIISKQFTINVFAAEAAGRNDINFEPDRECDPMLNGDMPLKGAVVEISDGNIKLDLSHTNEADLNTLYPGWDDKYGYLLIDKPLPSRIPRKIGFSVNAPAGAKMLDAYRNGKNVYAAIAENYAVLDELAGYMVTGNEYRSNDPEDYNRFTVLTPEETENHWILAWKDESGQMLKVQQFSFTVQSPAELSQITNPPDIQVYNGTEFANITLPETVTTVLSNGESSELNVNWLEGDYINDKVGEYIVYGELQLPSGLINPQQLKAQLKIKVTSGPSGGGSGSFGGGGAVESGTTISSGGGSVEKDGVTVEIPAGAVAGDIKVEIQKVNRQNITVAPRSRLIGDVFEISRNQSGNFNKPVKISLSFDKSQVDTDKYQLSLFWFNEETMQWIELDDVKVDVMNGIVSGEVKHFTKFAILAVEKNDIFVTNNLSDIEGHWAEDYIKNIVAQGIASGYADGTFRPDDRISRAEFCKFIVLAAGLNPVENSELKFSDTEEISSWARPYVAAAVKAGIIFGYGDQSFKPQHEITRVEIACMVMRALQQNNDAKTSVKFNDAEDIPAWALSSVAQAVEKQIISGFPDNTFRAADPATRAQAAKIISQMIKN